MIKPLDWSGTIGLRVRVYRNLNNGTMSIQTKQGVSWKVAGHVTDAVIQSITFHISEKGQARVRRDKCKNVHAWGEGVLLAQFDATVQASIPLAYNPYEDATFVERRTNRVITSADYLVVRENLVYVSGYEMLPTDTKPKGKVLQFPQLDLFSQSYQFAIAA